MKVLITGATGFIGKELGKKLCEAGHEIFILTRNRKKALLEIPFPCEIIEADLNEKKTNDPRLKQIEAVFHLAGENIGEGRWNAEKKKAILFSREKLTSNLLESLKQNKDLKVFTSVSAVGYYGDTGEQLVSETGKNGSDFLANVCHKWESQVSKEKIAQRNIILRLGMVLSPFGGAFLKILTPYRLGFGGVLGSGKQWMSWIHIHDLVNLMKTSLEDETFNGIYNAVAPEPITNKKFSEILASELHTKLFLPVPAFALNLALGEKALIVLISQKVSSSKLQSTSFQFEFPNMNLALKNCAQPYQDGDLLFYTEQFIPLEIEKVFPFFSDAKNLEKITPELVHFKLEKMSSPTIQKGSLIDYKLKIHGIPVKWKTLIQIWDPPHQFSDIQLKGPYKKWHHTHSFKTLGTGTLMTDQVQYQLPLSCVGELCAGSFVRSDIEKIFSYRREAVLKSLL